MALRKIFARAPATNAQPAPHEERWNLRGYANNAWHRVVSARA